MTISWHDVSVPALVELLRGAADEGQERGVAMVNPGALLQAADLIDGRNTASPEKGA